MAEWEKCVDHTVDKTWCGKPKTGFTFVDVDHAVLVRQQEGYLTVCEDCVEKIEALLISK